MNNRWKSSFPTIFPGRTVCKQSHAYTSCNIKRFRMPPQTWQNRFQLFFSAWVRQSGKNCLETIRNFVFSFQLSENSCWGSSSALPQPIATRSLCYARASPVQSSSKAARSRKRLFLCARVHLRDRTRQTLLVALSALSWTITPSRPVWATGPRVQCYAHQKRLQQNLSMLFHLLVLLLTLHPTPSTNDFSSLGASFRTASHSFTFLKF